MKSRIVGLHVVNLVVSRRFGNQATRGHEKLRRLTAAVCAKSLTRVGNAKSGRLRDGLRRPASSMSLTRSLGRCGCALAAVFLRRTAYAVLRFFPRGRHRRLGDRIAGRSTADCRPDLAGYRVWARRCPHYRDHRGPHRRVAAASTHGRVRRQYPAGSS
jgi:hypothetical protein